VMLLALGRDGKVRDINQFGADILGASIGEIVGKANVGFANAHEYEGDEG